MNYYKLLQAILDVAEEMLVCGAEVARVEDSINRMCDAYGCTRTNAFIMTSNIQVTTEAPDGEILTQIRRIVRNDTNFDRLDYLNDLSRYICANKPDLNELVAKYEEVMTRKPLPIWIEYAGAVLAASSFCIFFGGSWLDGLATAILAAIITVITRTLSKIEQNQLAKTFVTSLIAGFLAIVMVKIGIGAHTDKIMIGGIMLLIPGIALINSVRDMLTGDLVSGLFRLLNALLTAIVIAIGFALAIILTGGGA